MPEYIFDDRFIDIMPLRPTIPLHEVFSVMADGFKEDTRGPLTKLRDATLNLWLWPWQIWP